MLRDSTVALESASGLPTSMFQMGIIEGIQVTITATLDSIAVKSPAKELEKVISALSICVRPWMRTIAITQTLFIDSLDGGKIVRVGRDVQGTNEEDAGETEFLGLENTEFPYVRDGHHKKSYIGEKVGCRKSDEEIGRFDTMSFFRCSIPEVTDGRTLEDGSGLKGDEPEKEIPVDYLACNSH